MIGKEFEIPEEFKEIIKENSTSINKHKMAMDHHSHQLYLQGRKFWATIREIMPELDFEKYGMAHDEDAQVIRYQIINP